MKPISKQNLLKTNFGVRNIKVLGLYKQNLLKTNFGVRNIKVLGL